MSWPRWNAALFSAWFRPPSAAARTRSISLPECRCRVAVQVSEPDQGEPNGTQAGDGGGRGQQGGQPVRQRCRGPVVDHLDSGRCRPAGPRTSRARPRSRRARGCRSASRARVRNRLRCCQDRPAYRRGAKTRRNYIFERQSRAGRCLCRTETGSQSGHRHAIQCSRGEAKCHRCSRRRDRYRWPRELETKIQSRAASGRVWLRDDSALRRFRDHRRTGNMRPGNPRRSPRRGSRVIAG